MNVSFHGIKNVLGLHCTQNSIAKSDKNYKPHVFNDGSHISFEVDNNETQDLDKAQKIFVKYNSLGSNRIVFQILDNDKYILNGKPIKFDDKNFKIFETLLGFIKKISKTKPEDFIVDDCFENLLKQYKEVVEQKLQKTNDDKGIKLFEQWDPFWVKEAAKQTMKTVNANIMQYFEV